MKKIGCIIIYSKPIGDKTEPKGTIIYDDGSEEEVSLKEAAEKAIEMAFEYGFPNAINNERYFNTTYEDFMNNKSDYIDLAKKESKELEGLNAKKPPIRRKINDLPEIITEVEPPKIVKGEPKKPKEIVEKIISEEQVVYGPKPEEIMEKLEDIQDVYGPSPAPNEEVSEEEPDFEMIEKAVQSLFDEEDAKQEELEPSQKDLDSKIKGQNDKAKRR